MILSDGVFCWAVGFFEWRCYHFSGLCLLSFKCIVNKFALLKCCFVKPLEIMTTTTEIYSFVADQH